MTNSVDKIQKFLSLIQIALQVSKTRLIFNVERHSELFSLHVYVYFSSCTLYE